MDFAETRSKIRAIIFAITGFVEALLFLRITLDLIVADSDNVLVSIINQLTNPLIAPFNGLVTLPPTGILEFLNINAIVAFVVYILAAIAIAETITAFVYDNFKDIFQNIVDALFKFLESFLILRIIFDLFAVGLTLNSPQFVKVVYGFTEWAQGIIFDQPFLSGKVNISTIICLIIVVIIDLLTERFLDSIFLQVTTVTKKVHVNVPKVNVKSLIPKAPAKKEEPKSSQEIKPQPIQQNIVINVPVPQGLAQPQPVNGQSTPSQMVAPNPALPPVQVLVQKQPLTIQGEEVTKPKPLPTLQGGAIKEG